jgi:ATP-binding cassette subfamily F protein 3
MLNIHNLSVSFGGTYLFEEVTFRLVLETVVLLEKNGAGKSAKNFAKDFAPDSGVISGKELEWVFASRY